MISPTICSPDDEAPLTESQVDSWQNSGYALVDNLFPQDLIESMRKDAYGAFPAPNTEESRNFTDFGGGMSFPTFSKFANELILHPRLLVAVCQLLKVESPNEIRLTQAEIWPKYGRDPTAPLTAFDNSDQRIHCDYPNHTLTHPPEWSEPDAVELILYLTDVEDCGGATAVVPKLGPDDEAYKFPIIDTPGVGNLEWVNDKESAEKYLSLHAPEAARFRADHLYPREKKVSFHVGTTLLYRHDTWHRGTPLDPGSLRIVMNMTFRKAQSEWISTLHSGWAWSMYRTGLTTERLIASLTVQQRSVLGFPKPGSSYWTPATLIAVHARYGCFGFDIKPYAEAMVKK